MDRSEALLAPIRYYEVFQGLWVSRMYVPIASLCLLHTEHGVLSARLRTGEDSGGVDAARRVAYVLPAGSCIRVVRTCMGSV